MLPQFITALALLPALIAGSPVPRALPPCSAKTVACSCPAGSVFGRDITYATIGAKAQDLYAIMGDYFETNWFGLPSLNTQGDKNAPGALRTLNITSNGSTYQLIEKLTFISYNRASGSFHQDFEQANIPVLVPQAQGGGGYYGYWVSLDVKQTATPYQSIIVWGVSHCVIGNPFPFASFHENTIKSVTATLQSQGKIKGTNIGPYSVST